MNNFEPKRITPIIVLLSNLFIDVESEGIVLYNYCFKVHYNNLHKRSLECQASKRNIIVKHREVRFRRKIYYVLFQNLAQVFNKVRETGITSCSLKPLFLSGLLDPTQQLK